MSDEDARFADGDPAPDQRLTLRADDADSLAVIAALMQDAVGKTSEISWMPKRRIFALVANRFRWEDADAAQAGSRPYQRRRMGLHAQNVLSVKATGFDVSKAQEVFELLTVTWTPGDDGVGEITLICSGGAAFVLYVEALDLRMSDLDSVWHTTTLPRHEDDA